MNEQELIGMRVGRLVVVACEWSNKQTSGLVLCKCDCGNDVVVQRYSLTRKDEHKRTRSCGCLRRETLLRVHTKHGMAKRGSAFPEFNLWKDMIKRCTNKNRSDYKYYGGRGISVCDRWRVFENFYLDMGKRPAGMTIDRINTYGNYEPGNCRWVTIQEQQNNRRSCVYIERDGKKMNMKQWARALGVPYSTMQKKIKAGKSIDQILLERM